MTAGFTITGGKGFRLTFANGWTISVQFGVFNYCEHHDDSDAYGVEAKFDNWQSLDAEVAIISPNGTWHEFDGSQVRGYCTTDEVAELITITANRPSND